MRKEDILKVIGDKSEAELKILDPLIDDIVFLEGKLKELRSYPFISVKPEDPIRQKTTPAGKQYKELLQQYINCLKVIISAVGDENIEEDSPLRQWARGRING